MLERFHILVTFTGNMEVYVTHQNWEGYYGYIPSET